MINALENLDYFKIINNIDETDDSLVEEEIIYLYLAMRLKPLVGFAGINANRVNNIANFFADNYQEQGISLDLMVNALYNYINATKTCPSDRLLSDDIVTLLEDYLEK